jgi:hypothetical protein
MDLEERNLLILGEEEMTVHRLKAQAPTKREVAVGLPVADWSLRWPLTRFTA